MMAHRRCSRTYRGLLIVGLLGWALQAQGEVQRPPGAGTAAGAVANVHLRGGRGTQVYAGSVHFPAEVGMPLLRSDELRVPPGEFLVVALQNGYLVRIDEDLTLRVGDIVMLGAPPTRESLAIQLEQLVTRDERVQAERLAGTQSRLASADSVPAQADGADKADRKTDKPAAGKRGAATKAAVRDAVAQKGTLGVIGATSGKAGSTADGLGGLGLSGTGRGGGGTGEGTIGLGNVGTIGHGAGGGSGSGYGSGAGGLGAHRAEPAQVRIGKVAVEGKLAPEIVTRVVRQNLNRLRYCYERVLIADPAAGGAMLVQWTIGPDGNVVVVNDVKGVLPDGQLRGCVLQAFRTLRFPAPQGGDVVVARVPLELGKPATSAVPPAPEAPNELPEQARLRTCLRQSLAVLPVPLGTVTVQVKRETGKISRVALDGGLATPDCARQLLVGKPLGGEGSDWRRFPISLK